MATYVLLHGAGGDSFYWHWVAPALRARGHDVVTPDFPVEDDSAGLEDYVQVALSAIGGRTDLIVVGQSMGGLTAPIVASRVPTRLLVLVAAMVPRPGETPGQWWAHTGQEQALHDCAVAEGRDPLDTDASERFLHDLPPDVLAEVLAHGALGQSGTPFREPWPLSAWPSVPTRFLACRQDRFFPLEFQRRQVLDRLGFLPDEMDGTHLPAISHPEELVSRLEAYRSEVLPQP